MATRQLILCGVLLEGLYLILFLSDDLLTDIATFIIVNAIAYTLLAFIVHANRPAGPRVRDAHRLWVIVGFAILFRLTLLPHDPVATDDIYRYLWDGKVAAIGVNPFQYAPADPVLISLHSSDLPSKINFPEMRTIYPPLAQGLFLASHLLFGESIMGLKLLLVLCDLGSMVLLLKLLARFDMDSEALILYAWSPLPIMYFALDGHIDALGIPFLLLFLNFLYASRHVRAAISLGLGGLAKLYPLFLLPLLLAKGLKIRRFAWAWLPGIPILMLFAGYLVYWHQSSGGLFESMVVFNSTFCFNNAFFILMWRMLGSNAAAHLASATVFACCLGLIFFMKRSMLEKVFLTYLCFTLLSPVVHPWYLTWLAALLVLRWSVSVFTLLGLSNLSNFVVYWHRQTGVWEDKMWILGLEYLPFLVLLAWELSKGSFSIAQTSARTERRSSRMLPDKNSCCLR
jgi:hypothetical protein